MGLPRPTTRENLLEGVTQLVDELDGMFPGVGWNGYVPVWTSTGTQPALGNGSLTGLYNKVDRLVHGVIYLSPGSTTTFGTGGWSISLPVPNARNGVYHGHGFCYDTSASTLHQTVAVLRATTMDFYAGGSPAPQVFATAPFTWAATDALSLSFWYEALS